MNKFTFLLLAFFLTIQLQGQTGLEIISECPDSLICVSSSSCDSTSYSISVIALTDCPNTIINYNCEVDYFDDGTIDTFVVSPQFTNIYPLGTHRITYTLFDFCGQMDNCDFVFEVIDCEAPIIECTTAIDTFIMPSSGQFHIWARELITMNSSDNCTPFDSLHFSFSPAIEDSIIAISCADIPADCLIPIIVWGTDQAGNQDTCTATIAVSDANGACSQPPATITIESQTWGGNDMIDVLYTLNGYYTSNLLYLPSSSCFINNSMAPPVGDTLNAYYDGDIMNGVTTFDIVLIAKHILGTELFLDPNQIIAADVNKSGTITALDIVEIRKIILQIDDKFSSGENWIFDPNEVIVTYAPYSVIEFTGIKLGDVNDSADPNNFSNSSLVTRTLEQQITLFTKNQFLKKGTVYNIPIFSKNFKDIFGGQFTLSFDTDKATLKNIQSGLEFLNEENFGLTKVQEGIVLVSWNTSQKQKSEQDQPLFYLNFEITEDVNLEDLISLNSLSLNAEAYVEKSNEIELHEIQLVFEGDYDFKNSNFSITPNPFLKRTNFNFSLEKSERIILKIFDTHGRLVFQKAENRAAGNHQIEVFSNQLSNTGIYFYQLSSATISESGRIILLAN